MLFFNENYELKYENNGKREISVALPRAEAVILYPSLCTPACASPGGSFHVILLTNSSLDKKNDLKINNDESLVESRISMQLRVSAWDDLAFESSKGAGEFSDFSKVSYKHLGSVGSSEIHVTSEGGAFQATVPSRVVNFYRDKDYNNIVLCTVKLKETSKCKCLELQWFSVTGSPRSASIQNTQVEHVKHFLYSSDSKASCTYRDVRNRHPVFCGMSKVKGIMQLSDLHISERHNLYKKSKLQPVPGSNKVSLGAKCHSAKSSVEDILQRAGEDADVSMVWITGDLIDFQYNIRPEVVENASSNEVWKLLDINSNTKQKLNDSYSPYVDLCTGYKTIVDFISKYNKPVFFIYGNHDAYELPFGISPRLFKNEAINFYGIRANSTIPMDHNLTYYEALLLYGPSYGKLLKQHYLREYNFNADMRMASFLLLTPIVNIMFCLEEYRFIGLDWGDDEIIAEAIVYGGGDLPRANLMLSGIQNNMLGDTGDDKQNFIFSHSPVVNYDYNIPLSYEASINYSGKSFSKYDVGSFKSTKIVLMDILTYKKTIMFSGHSHRAACYALRKHKNSYKVVASSIKKSFFARPEELVGYNIVCGSGGPIGARNIDNEFGGYGLDTPSGVKAKFSKNNIIIKSEYAKCSGAKPRFCVLADCFDVQTEGGLLLNFIGYGAKPNKYMFTLNKSFRENNISPLIEYINFILCNKKSNKQIRYKTSLKSISDSNKYMIILAEEDMNDIVNQFHSNQSAMVFMEVMFNLNGLVASSEYDNSEPWLIRIEIIPVYLSNQHRKIVAWQIIRHRRYGEVPEFDVYGNTEGVNPSV